MLARVLTLRFDPALEVFDEDPLQELLKTREVFAIRNHFFVRNEVPYLAVLVTYGPQPSSAAAPGKERSRDASRRALVSEKDLPLFNAQHDLHHQPAAGRDGPLTPGEHEQARRHRRHRQGQAGERRPGPAGAVGVAPNRRRVPGPSGGWLR